jgi:hypothetical protein
MKNTLMILAAVAGMGSMAMATTSFDVTFPISPQGTFLRLSANDVCAAYNIPGCNLDPTFINLAALGVQAGDTLQLLPVGGECFYDTPNCTVYPPDLAGVFTTSNMLLGSSFENRIPGEITPGAGAALIGDDPNLFTFTGDLDTTIPDDFYLPATVVVPAGANYLLVGVLDSAYSDNSSSNLGVEIRDLILAIPEPGTFALGLSAIGGLWLLRRIKSLRER